jgi:P27 family predicted phage terminase small subunit
MPSAKVPTPLRLLRGNPSKRPLPIGEPRPAQVEPPMPAGLDPIARTEWRRLAPRFVELGILTEADGMAFGELCTAYAASARIRMALKKCGYRVLAMKHSFLEKNGEDGRSDEVMAVEPKINPLFSQQRLASQTLRFWCQEFGTTPSSRGRIQVPGVGKDVDPQEAFLNER